MALASGVHPTAALLSARKAARTAACGACSEPWQPGSGSREFSTLTGLGVRVARLGIPMAVKGFRKEACDPTCIPMLGPAQAWTCDTGWSDFSKSDLQSLIQTLWASPDCVASCALIFTPPIGCFALLRWQIKSAKRWYAWHATSTRYAWHATNTALADQLR